MNLSAPFIKRPVATSLLTAALALAGILAFTLLPVAPLPEVDFPTISGACQSARGQPGDHGILRGNPARAAIRTYCRRDGDDFVEPAQQYADHASIRSGS